MRIWPIIGTAAVVLGVVIGSGIAPSPAHAACPAFPEVAWWNSSHAAVTKLVARRYQGDWTPYIAKWEAYRRSMQGIHDKGGTAIVKSRDVRLKGDELAAHIGQIAARIDASRCLAQEADVAALENFATAAGGAVTKTRRSPAKTTELANVPVSSFKVKVTATCERGAAVFQIDNLGDKWPKVGTVSLYRAKGKLVSKRNVRLSEGQKMTFKVRPRKDRRNGFIGMWIKPTWMERKFKFDGSITCD